FQYNNSVERFTVHPHVLRKFFRSRLATVIPVDVVEALMGHEGYLTQVYRRYSIEDLANYYKQGEHTLLIFASEDVSKLRADLEERNKQLQTLINGLASENMELKTQVKNLNEKIERLEAIVNRLLASRPSLQIDREAVEAPDKLAEKLRKEWVAEE
ncbi:MAG: hypothetical protein RMI04_04200, partial [Thermofilaceae archaeon]|nr:hypothetical protein [Thermofilaceae archaeon]